MLDDIATLAAPRLTTNHALSHPLFDYMIEREKIRQRKEAGQPWPWTDDPILQEGRFTNVRRSDDKTTRELMANFYGPHVAGARPGDVLFNCAIGRLFHGADVACHIGGQTDWDPEATIARLRTWPGLKWPSAYIVGTNGESGDKAEYICRKALTPLWHARHRIAENAMLPCYGWEYLCGGLRELKGIGGTGFMAKELAQDFILATGWKPRDLNTFTPVGPGARRGLNRLHGRRVDEDIKSSSRSAEYRFLKQTRELFEMRQRYLPHDFVELQLHDIQFCLCEYDKLERAREGGKLKRRYAA